MSRKTTIFVTAIAAVSIGALGAGAATGLVHGPGPGGQAARAAARAPENFRLQARIADAGRTDGPGSRFGPGFQDPENPSEARHLQFGGERDGRGPQIMFRGGGGRMAHARMPQSRGGEDRDLDLTADEAGTLISARLIMQGNDRLRVESVAAQGEDTYVVDVVTLEDSLVTQFEVDRGSGRRTPVR